MLLRRSGIKVAIITGRTSNVVSCRAKDLGVEHVFHGVGDKGAVSGQLLEQLGLQWSELAFMGDDLIDLPAMTRCGLAIAPANARQIVKERAHMVTEAGGGKGAVREAIEFILAAQGKVDLHALLRELGRRGVNEVLAEAGTRLNAPYLEA